MSVDTLSDKFDVFMVESREWRSSIESDVKEATKQITANTAQIQCLALHFNKYKPQLEDGLTRRKFWAAFWEERRKELLTHAVKFGFLTLLGLIVYALAGKANDWVRSSVAKIIA